MNKLGEKSLKTLEYYEILEKLAGQVMLNVMIIVVAAMIPK